MTLNGKIKNKAAILNTIQLRINVFQILYAYCQFVKTKRPKPKNIGEKLNRIFTKLFTFVEQYFGFPNL